VPYYVNLLSRTRHADADCRALRRSREFLQWSHETGYWDGYEEREGVPPPTYETRVVEIEPADADEVAALEAFTAPCKLCVPGARELGEHFHYDFEV
jgi:hypothetical protein